jgi:antitoxin YefM
MVCYGSVYQHGCCCKVRGWDAPPFFYRQKTQQKESLTHRNQNIGLKLYILSIKSYPNPVHKVVDMDVVSVNRFRDNLKTLVEQVASSHEPLKVTRRAGDDFIVMSADDWEREQESLYILQNNSLIEQIAKSLTTHSQSTGYQPTEEQLNEITGI